jgi:outer membrane protein OmpA-like peptidoglycan-associated protein
MMELYDSILFEPGKQEISAANLLRIKKFGQHMLNEDKAYDIQIIGHSDNQEADPSFLDQLSLDRAEAIRQILLQQGIASSRIMVDGYGPAQPAGDNNNPVARKFNRRVQLFIVVVTEQ